LLVFVSIVLAGLSVKFIAPLTNWLKIDFIIKGEMLMNVIMMATYWLGAGACGDCNLDKTRR